MAADSILDEVVVAPVALMPAVPAGYGPQVSLARTIQTPLGRKLQFNAPFFARGLNASQMGPNWPVVCGILRNRGIPIYATVDELKAVPAAQVPARIAQRFLGQPLLHSEVTLADAFELVNCNPNGTGWCWPYEISSSRDLKTLVTTLRAATGGEVPLGMTLPLNAKPADLRMGLESSIDYLTLKHCPESLTQTPAKVANLAALSIMAARKLCVQYGRNSIPVLLDVPITCCDHLIKLVALGASAVNIAAVVRNALPPPEPRRYESMLTENLLGGLPGVQKVVRELPPVERAIGELCEQLSDVLRFVGLLDIAELDSTCLQSINAEVADQLRIASLAVRTV